MDKLKVQTWIGVVVLLIVCGVCIVIWRPQSSGDVAAWAQGISTSLAVIAALFVAAWQSLHAQQREFRQRARDAADRTNTALQLGAYVEAVCERVLEHCRGLHAAPARDFLTNAAGELQAIGVAFDKYQPTDFNTYAELKPLLSVMAARAALELHLKRALERMDQINVAGELVAAFGGAEDSIHDNVKQLGSAASAARVRAGRG